jgi:hypothetical protein
LRDWRLCAFTVCRGSILLFSYYVGWRGPYTVGYRLFSFVFPLLCTLG